MEEELWSDLASFMNSEVAYAISRLLPADLKVSSKQENASNGTFSLNFFFFKTLYKRTCDPFDCSLKPNPFADDFECQVNEQKGGLYITENICFGW